MCGINGCNFGDVALVEKMNAVTSHRGPDDTGVFSDGQVTLGNNRLAILDLSSAGHQPMVSADERYVIAFNGEIYNYKELKAELRSYPYKGESDTEVLLAGFSRWGSDLFRRLNGIFAFAVWDKEKRELYLVRDRMGVKPLYIYKREKKVLFSSELKALLMDSAVDRFLHHEALERYLRLGYTPGTETLIKDIEKVPAASFVCISSGVLRIEPYWVPEHSVIHRDTDVARALLRETIDAAVERQLVSDRPVGLYLSGGIDSSVILDSMAKSHSNIDTFSVGFDVAEGEYEKFNADFLLARRTAAHYGTRHHEFMLGTSGLAELFERAVYHMDEPIGNATSLAQFALSREAKKRVAVVLTGDGGDELFGGYERYRTSFQMGVYQRYVPKALRSLASFDQRFAKFNTPPGGGRYALFHFIKDPVLRAIAPVFATARLQNEAQSAIALFGDISPADAFLRLDREWWLMEEALLRTDRMTMASGMEARVPFLDNEVVALADSIAVGEKVTLRRTKAILKDAYSDRLPAYLFSQPKRGWFSPGAKWLREPAFLAYTKDVLSEGYSGATAELFDWPAVHKILDEHVVGTSYNMPVLWALLSLQVWAKTFKISA